MSYHREIIGAPFIIYYKNRTLSTINTHKRTQKTYRKEVKKIKIHE